MTIKGDELDPQEVQRRVDLPSDIYLKGSTIYKFETPLIQKTNRWVYDVNEDCSNSREVQSFLTKQLKLIFLWRKNLEDYIAKFESCIELIVYADNKTYIALSKQNLKFLSQIGAKFSISFN